MCRWLIVAYIAILSFLAPFSAEAEDFRLDGKHRYHSERVESHKCSTAFCGRARGGEVSTYRITGKGLEKPIYLRIYKDKRGKVVKIR